METKILDYLVGQHDRYLRHIDALDQKIAQTIAANLIVLSFVFDKGLTAQNKLLFYVGLIIIVASLAVCVQAYRTAGVQDSPKPDIYLKQINSKDKKEISELVKDLTDDNRQNLCIQDSKSRWFNLALAMILVGMTLLVGGYYV